MTTLLFLLTLLLLMEDSEQLQTYIRFNRPLINKEVQIDVSCDLFPKTLSVGDMLYAQITSKNITQEPLEYSLGGRSLASDIFIRSVFIQRNTATGYGLEMSDIMEIYERRALESGPPLPKRTLLPGDTLLSGPQSILVPPPGEYDKQVWKWDTPTKGERIMLTFSATLFTATTSIESNTVQIMQELKIKPRPQEELNLIKEWYNKARGFSSLWRPDSPTAAEWREFEEQLTPGTLRNHIRMLRTLVEIAQDENKGKRQAMFDEMLEWINELHPLEKEGLTKRAYEIVAQQYQTLGNEIAIPVMPNDKELLE